jgi:hypothetical protein
MNDEQPQTGPEAPGSRFDAPQKRSQESRGRDAGRAGGRRLAVVANANRSRNQRQDAIDRLEKPVLERLKILIGAPCCSCCTQSTQM